MARESTTEQRNPNSQDIDALTSAGIVALMNAEDRHVAEAVGKETAHIAHAIDVVANRLAHAGRLLYVGAGTSGRLGVLDASECPPTFNTDPEQVIGLIAGGPSAVFRAIEGAEDSQETARVDLDAVHLSAADVVVGIATSGHTPYVLGALRYAQHVGAYAIGFTCNEDSSLSAHADLMIAPIVGPEVISGSTRLKAGTATKMVLNMITTGAMVLLGKTYGNLMVDLRATNSKLVRRTRRIVSSLTDLAEDEAETLLARCDGELKTAIVTQLASCTPEEARRRLDQASGRLRVALEQT